jgi:hypothetical protein
MTRSDPVSVTSEWAAGRVPCTGLHQTLTVWLPWAREAPKTRDAFDAMRIRQTHQA